jgi:hypothetical protein
MIHLINESNEERNLEKIDEKNLGLKIEKKYF